MIQKKVLVKGNAFHSIRKAFQFEMNRNIFYCLNSFLNFSIVASTTEKTLPLCVLIEITLK